MTYRKVLGDCCMSSVKTSTVSLSTLLLTGKHNMTLPVEGCHALLLTRSLAQVGTFKGTFKILNLGKEHY